jgi:hypothetical protein
MPNSALAKRLRWGCSGLAVLALLVMLSACTLGYAGLRRGVPVAPPLRVAHTLEFGPVMLRSGLTMFDSCLDSYQCPTRLFGHRAGQPAAFRLWLFLGNPPDETHGYKLMDFPVAPQTR